MSYGVLVYGYATDADRIVTMPRVDSYRDDHGRTILVDNDDIYPVEWAMDHYKYGQYVYVEDPTGWCSNKVVFGICLGESGDKFDIKDMEVSKFYVNDIVEVVKFFCNIDVDVDDFGYHLMTIYD